MAVVSAILPAVLVASAVLALAFLFWLYELVRRHCRYIIVSDCGADPQVAFDDFGNAARRIREDFGIEIDIDLSPLRPNPSLL